ncbi:hypothetical protein C8E97_1758 [Saccharothrix australiensis]|uniref:Uncharacterized protein n=1 Tax=Saccharothrix australiensis TaxID=2072 RepID=A0A495VWA4_9PSEU|nr:hypothetical protein C8E97_1758 [Saccharothrix australiensis]
MFDAWRRALGESASTKEAAEAWRHRRYRFAHRLGAALVGAQADGRPSVVGHVVYGVWLEWGLLYVGQTGKAERRLRDLAVGESHHLANTFPPEIWHRVVVVSWPRLPEAAELSGVFGPGDISLGLEHRLQAWLGPLANASRRTSDGRWRSVDWVRSDSVGARVGRRIDRLFSAVQDVWQEASRAEASTGDGAGVYRVVRPAALLAE